MSHTMKIWERVMEVRLTHEVMICEQQYDSMQRKSTTEVLFALRIWMEDIEKVRKSYIVSLCI